MFEYLSSNTMYKIPSFPYMLLDTNMAVVSFFVFCFWFSFLQYILPHEHEKLSQVELLVVDEAAAIPLPVVKSLLGPYLVFLSSTVNGYVMFLLIIYHILPHEFQIM